MENYLMWKPRSRCENCVIVKIYLRESADALKKRVCKEIMNGCGVWEVCRKFKLSRTDWKRMKLEIAGGLLRKAAEYDVKKGIKCLKKKGKTANERKCGCQCQYECEYR